MIRQFTPAEQVVLRMVQDSLPDSLTPYADMARMAGLKEQEVLALLRSLKASGTIRRFGASIKHQRTGWTHNAMVAWQVRPEQVEACGTRAAQYDTISHVYYRPSRVADWPYELYTMIHGHSEAECLAVVEDLRRTSELHTYVVLRSLKELKKISMTYFS